MLRSSDIDNIALQIDTTLLNWKLIYDLDDKLKYFNLLFILLLDKHAPLQKFVVKSNQDSFVFNQTIINHRNIRDFLYEVWRRNKNATSLKNYRKQRNLVNDMIRKAKFQHFKRNIFNIDLPCEQLWKNFQRHGLSKSKADYNSTKFLPDEFSDHFAVSESLQSSSSPPLERISSNRSFYFSNVSKIMCLLQLTVLNRNPQALTTFRLHLFECFYL